ncbi:Rpp14/Pop5 family-domain-containing protein [Russula brevipes]|nr:Rpp14/Pop5 family-domain-containing protein [Russula brevipes]
MVRFKNRWLLVEFIRAASTTTSTSTAAHPSEEISISSKEIFNALKQSVLLHFGDTGWGEVAASLAVKYFSSATNFCILRVARGAAARTTHAALVLLDRVGGGGGGEGLRVVPHVVHVSGTMKHAQIRAVEWNRGAIARVKAGLDVYGAIAPRGNGVVAHFETSIQELEQLQD